MGRACVGRLSHTVLGERQTRRGIDAISAVALAHQARQRNNVKTICLQVEAGVERLGWVLLERAFDCTPVRVRPGSCTHELAPKDGTALVDWRPGSSPNGVAVEAFTLRLWSFLHTLHASRGQSLALRAVLGSLLAMTPGPSRA